jgi:hypothetical protein
MLPRGSYFADRARYSRKERPRTQTAGAHTGNTLVRGFAGRVAGRQEDETFAVALVEIEEALVPAFIVEEHEDGAYTVFVPSVPTPAAGAVYILPKERVHLVDIPFNKAVSVISKWGSGARDLRTAMIGKSMP